MPFAVVARSPPASVVDVLAELAVVDPFVVVAMKLSSGWISSGDVVTVGRHATRLALAGSSPDCSVVTARDLQATCHPVRKRRRCAQRTGAYGVFSGSDNRSRTRRFTHGLRRHEGRR